MHVTHLIRRRLGAERRVETAVVGAGQAGLALSSYLSAVGHPHVLLERGRVGERWRTRWDSLTLLSPNWMNRLPGATLPRDCDGFLARKEFVAALAAYARSFRAPVREGVAVERVSRAGDGFRVETDRGAWSAAAVVVATGDAAFPRLPALAREAPRGLAQIHSSEYRSPAQLGRGGVLVVGAGPSGLQIALELRRAGREVVLASGRHTRVPRRYRGRDIWRWLAALGEMDRPLEEVTPEEASRSVPSLGLTGANGGERIDLGVLHEAGVSVVGRLRGFDGARASVADDLATNVADAEARMRRLLARIDAHVERTPGVEADAPEAVSAVALPPSSESVDLAARGIGTIVWATGYRREYPWLDVPGAVAADGEIVHRHGITAVPGLYALGLRFQTRRNSHFIGGVGTDAGFLAAEILGASPSALALAAGWPRARRLDAALAAA